MLTARRSFVVGQASGSSSAPVQPLASRSIAMASRVALAGSWEDSRLACAELQRSIKRGAYATGAPSRKAVTMMGNKATGGPFSPLVVVVRNVVGEKDFNKLRGKAISLHSQVIKDFCKQFGVDNKQVQGVIRLAKKNGEFLGFLA
ncbi:thylakoid membrane protein [Haematococcus lacustris]|nr:hypothetical protein QJQ45_029268 [Haematococcus lacustris]KAJ9512616.1 hypothetical protein QJQ45_018875 [Haematococcus lacustris]